MKWDSIEAFFPDGFLETNVTSSASFDRTKGSYSKFEKKERTTVRCIYIKHGEKASSCESLGHDHFTVILNSINRVQIKLSEATNLSYGAYCSDVITLFWESSSMKRVYGWMSY
jgi:hypothetical protein